MRILADSSAAGRHVPFLLIGLAVPLLAALLEVRDGRQVGFWFLPGVSFPEVCFSRRWLGFACPGCGLTRSIVALVQGRLAESLAMHRFGWFVLALIVLQVPYRLWRMSGRDVPGLSHPRTEILLWGLLIFLLCLNRGWSLLAGG